MNGSIGCQIARDMNVYTQGSYDHINSSTVINVLSSQNIARSMNVHTREILGVQSMWQVLHWAVKC